MIKEQEQAYSEVIDILKNMDIKYQNKIPQKLKCFFEDNCSKDYKVNINYSIPLKEQNLKPKTLALLAMLDLNYWCETEEERIMLSNRYIENEKKYQDELQKKYNSNDLFKKKPVMLQNINQEDLISVVEAYKKQTIFQKVINKIKEIIRKVF